MTRHPHVGRFKALSAREAAPDWTLAVAKDDPELEYLTPSQIADILCDGEGIHVSRQLVAAILGRERKTVARRRFGQRDRFRIMKTGEDAVMASSAFTATVIDPTKALSEIRRVEGLLGELRGDLRVCDPYVDKKTLDLLAECRSAGSVQLLTVNLQKEGPFRRDLDAFRREHAMSLNVRVAAAARLHDRYILHDEGMLLLGGSLNGLGKKQSFIVELGLGLRATVEPTFADEWNCAAEFR